MQSIIIDMDEVMADTMGGMINLYKERKYTGEIVYTSMREGSWIKGFPEEDQKMVREWLFEAGFFRQLPVMKDCIEVMKELNRKYKVFIVSAAIEFPNSLNDKLLWLNEHFPFLSWQQIVFCGSKSVVHGDYMIDDLIRNLDTFNGKKYLYSGYHNAEITGYDRVNNWQEVAKVFL